MKAAVHLSRFRGGLPFAIDRREPAGVDDQIRPTVDHLEEVLAEIEVVRETGARTGPRPIRHHLVEREDLLPEPAGMDVVDPHCLLQEELVEPGGSLASRLAAEH